MKFNIVIPVVLANKNKKILINMNAFFSLISFFIFHNYKKFDSQQTTTKKL